MIHRVAVSDAYRTSPARIRREWTVQDVLHAHVVLDMLEARREQEQQRAEDERRLKELQGSLRGFGG